MGHDGHLVQVFGDGLMVLFAADEGIDAACRQALRAARAMARRLDKLNADSDEPLRMGIHTGSAIVGEMGFRDATILTAVGEAVNTTARLEEATKELECQLVVSSEVTARAGIDVSAFQRRELPIRGRSGSALVHVVIAASELPEMPTEAFTLAAPLAGRRPTG